MSDEQERIVAAAKGNGEFQKALCYASCEGLNKILEQKCDFDDKCVFAAGAEWAANWILHYLQSEQNYYGFGFCEFFTIEHLQSVIHGDDNEKETKET